MLDFANHELKKEVLQSTNGRNFTRRTSTVRQIEMLVELAEGNKDLALGSGTVQWTKVWNDMKSRVRSKLAQINQSYQGTGRGPCLAVTLSALEERMADIIGRDVGPLANVAQDPFVYLHPHRRNSAQSALRQAEATKAHAEAAISIGVLHWHRLLKCILEMAQSGHEGYLKRMVRSPKSGGTAVPPPRRAKRSEVQGHYLFSKCFVVFLNPHNGLDLPDKQNSRDMISIVDLLNI